MIRTPLCDLLGIEHPVFQGGMAWIADASLAAAVSEAGGLGIIACGGAPLDWVEDQVRQAREITSKPIGANVMLMDPNAGELAKLLCELKVDVVTTGAGSPANYMEMWKEAGIKVIPVVASTALAVRMERLGADAYKERVLAAKDSDTIVTGRGSGHPARCLKNKFSRKVRSLEGDMAKNGDELEQMYLGSLRRAVEGDVDNGSMMAGQIAALVRERKTAKDVIDEIVSEAEALCGLSLEQVAALNARGGRMLAGAAE